MTARARILATILSRAVEGRWTGRLTALAGELGVGAGWVKEIVGRAIDVGAFEVVRRGTRHQPAVLAINPDALAMIAAAGREVPPWPEDHKMVMHALRAEGVSNREIGRRIGRTKNAVHGKRWREIAAAKREAGVVPVWRGGWE